MLKKIESVLWVGVLLFPGVVLTVMKVVGGWRKR